MDYKIFFLIHSRR